VTGVRAPLTSVLAASAVTLILVGRSGGLLGAAEGAIRSAVRAAFVPAEAAADGAFRPLDGVVAGFARAGAVSDVQAEAARQRERAESEAARADGLAAENARLAALLNLDGPAAGDGVAARVVSEVRDRSGGALLIDRGRSAGIAVGMPVVAAGGLVGRVVEVAPGHSTVLPLTDPASAVGVRCTGVAEESGTGPAGDQAVATAAVAQGVRGRTLRLDVLDPTVSLRAGAVAVTSGLRHSRFPAGLAVGRVAGSPGRFVVEPFAPPGRLEVVKVLRWTRER
jgi:rod shape-determining protein MreC